MTCTLGKGRMAAMARLLVRGSYPEITPEEASHEKVAAQSICRELREADEANLLEEDDMHVFDCKPLTDPLHLVCCNACKKPVKASQYAAHAERCRSFSSSEDVVLELDGGTGHKKPPRKGRKKLQVAHDNEGTAFGEQERAETIDGEDTAASESNMDDPPRLASSLSRDTKRMSNSINGPLVMDGSGVSPGSINHSVGLMSPSEKRTKRVGAGPLELSGGLEMVCGVTTEMGRSCRETHNYIPVPLATKIYHSQRNHLRAALGCLYQEALQKENVCKPLSAKLVQGNEMLSSLVSSPSTLLHDLEKDDMPQKKILAQSSESILGTSGGYPSAVNFPNQFQDNSFSSHAVDVETAPVGMMRTRYLARPYSFPSNPGTALPTVQQPNGSVSVI